MLAINLVVLKPMEQSDELIRRILDDRALEALGTLKHVSKERGEQLQRALVQHFYAVRRPICYEEYADIAKRIGDESTKASVDIRRKGSFFDLDEL